MSSPGIARLASTSSVKVSGSDMTQKLFFLAQSRKHIASRVVRASELTVSAQIVRAYHVSRC
jgi:hypothetical protein